MIYVDMDGFPIKRQPDAHPYNYDSFRVYKRGGVMSSLDCTIDSDRMLESDIEKFNSLCQEIWGNTGQYFHSRHPDEIQKFLSKWFGRSVILTGIMQCCNQSTGYPYWTFYYRDRTDGYNGGTNEYN